jgi:hypothetical protein
MTQAKREWFEREESRDDIGNMSPRSERILLQKVAEWVIELHERMDEMELRTKRDQRAEAATPRKMRV